MSDPTVIQCSSACTVTLDIETPFFNLDEDGAGQILVAIFMVWAVAWGFRQVIKALNSSGSPTEED